MKLINTLLMVVTCLVAGSAQIVTFGTPFPTPDQEITLFFDATQGNRGLENCACDVYLHTGVTPVGGDDWQYVQGDWGKAIPRLKMTRVSDNEYSFTMIIRDYYQLPDDLEVEQLSFVFRNADGSRAGREANGDDIFVDIFAASAPLLTRLETPFADNLVLNGEETVQIKGFASKPSTIRIEENGSVVATSEAGVTQYSYLYEPTSGPGNYEVAFIAREDASDLEDTTSFSLVLIPEPIVEDPPAGTELGMTREDDGSLTFLLEAPGKQHAILISNETDFQPNAEGVMKRSSDGRYFWTNLTPQIDGRWFIYQYLIDGELQVADPYSEVVLDPGHDQFITSNVNDDFPDYPADGQGILTLVDLEKEAYNWQVTDFTPPANEDLLIYELLVRDFLEDHSYQSLTDTLDYLQRLGINTIELMPVNEFEGNDSWGYNPSFHMALDKYYGSPEDFKRFVDEAHARGMAVVIDAVLNHVFSQSPLAQLYWDPVNFRPAADNPWLNVTARHPFNVGYDVDHQSPETQRWVRRVLHYWLDEYRVDGFRFDLSKGFTQVNSGDDVGFWSQYDATRVALWKSIGDDLWAANPNAILILEHFAENSEEIELSDYGFLVWGNMNFNYNEATMGYIGTSDFSGAFHRERNWNEPHLVTYMESHDEERMMYKNRQFGNSSGSYNTKVSSTALDRMELAHTFFWTVPGPKMMWQFGEVGYDFSINYCIGNGTINEDCRTGRKPVRWFYNNIPDRRDLYNYISDLNWLRTNHPAPFRDADPEYDVSGAVKTIFLDSDTLDMRAVGNFDVRPQSFTTTFPVDGIWYNYVNGDSITVSGGSHTFDLVPGEYALWMNGTIERPNLPEQVTSVGYRAPELERLDLYPNPAGSGQELYLRWESPDASAFGVSLINLQGQPVWQDQLTGAVRGVAIQLPGLPAGMYILQLRTREGRLLGTQRVVIGG